MSDDLFNECFEDLILVEGGDSDHAADHGGPTRYGITEAVARRAGYAGPMAELPLEIAKDIYRRIYWRRLRLDEIAILSRSIAAELFDTGVNMGTNTAAKFVQIALNALNRNGNDFADMAVDGILGPGTLAALRKYLQVRSLQDGAAVLLTALKCQQGARYLEIAAKDHSQEAFVFGWLKNRV